MTRLKMLYSMLICLLLNIFIAGCAGETISDGTDLSNESNSTGMRVPRRIIITDDTSLDTAPDDIRITLEFTEHTPQALYFVISNDTGYDIKYGDGYEIIGNQWGYAGQADYEFFLLPSGESDKIDIQVYEIGFGEFQLTKNITIDPENPATAKEHKLIAEFAIENTAIPSDLHGITMEVDEDFASAIGTMINVTNGFNNERIYFDKSFWLQQNVGGTWQDVSATGSDSFLFDTHSLAPRQILMITIYWEWLYGALPPGEYRIYKSFVYRSDDGIDTQYDLFSVFTLDDDPIPDIVQKDDGSSWGHPFGGVSTLRAEVTELLDPEYHFISQGNTGLLVIGMTPVWDNNRIGDRFYVFDNFNLLVIDSDGMHIRFSDIEVDAVVDITNDGVLLTSDPAIIASPLLITIAG